MGDESHSFEQARVRLEEIVSQVRKKDTSLERSLDLLEEGVRLANAATELVDHTEWRSVAAEAADAEAAGTVAADGESAAGDGAAEDAVAVTEADASGVEIVEPDEPDEPGVYDYEAEAPAGVVDQPSGE